MRTINEVKKAAREIVKSAPIEVSRLCADVIVVDVSSYDEIDGPTNEEREAREELKILARRANAIGYSAWVQSYTCLIDSAFFKEN